jgi:hypothetical protein
MSLRDGIAKMSKSDPSDMARVNLSDDADTVMRKVKKAKTDPEPLPSDPKGFEGRPEAENLAGIYAVLPKAGTGLSEFGGAQFSKFKEALARRTHPDRRRDAALMAGPVEIDRISARARAALAIAVRSSPRPRTSSASSAAEGQAPLATPVPIGQVTPVPPSRNSRGFLARYCW